MTPAYSIPYGRTSLSFNLPDDIPVHVVAPADVPAADDPLAVIESALDEPVGTAALADFAGVRSAAIAINDKTRPVPHDVLLPPLLARLEALGLPPEAITLIIATGAHAPMLPDEFGQVVLPDILVRYPVYSHDCDDDDLLVRRGETERGTPVTVNRRFAAANLRLVVGNIEPHQFQGFSGGVKSAAIGLAGRATINHNHSMMTDPAARLGRYQGNPARADVEAIGRLIDVHFALNAIINHRKRIVAAVAGEPRAVMAAGVPLARRICQMAVDAPFDLVIAAPGGHPKDLNLYQSQKALAHAALITRPGGTVILTAACPEGTGSRSYERWMFEREMTTHQAVLARFVSEGFQVGPHKAFQIARDAVQVRVLLRSEMAPDFVRRLLLTPVASLDEALRTALPDLPPGGRIAVMPSANATAPLLSTVERATGD